MDYQLHTVHPALLNLDILSIIFQSLDHPSLAILARTAKFLLDPAARELWRKGKCLSNLLLPFGSSVVIKEGKMSFSVSPTKVQWNRFNYYARHVRVLKLIAWDDIDSSCFSILSSHRPLLPHLQSLEISAYCFPARILFNLSIFFTASLQEFVLDYEDEILFLEPLIATLAATAPALQHLKIDLDPTDHEPAEFGASVLTFQNLHSISVLLTPLQAGPLLSHLTTLPSLSNITFNTTPLVNLSGVGSVYQFPAAKSFSIESESNNEVIQLMVVMRFDNLIWLEIDYRDQLVDNDRLFDAISICCGQFLHNIRIHGVADDHPFLQFPSLRPLCKFTDLCDFSLELSQYLYPTDEDILGITRAWSKLTAIEVELVHNDEPSSAFTLAGLLLLVEQCTKLMEISIAIDARHLPNAREPISRPGLIVNVYPEYSPIDCPTSLASFLSSVFPDACFELAGDSWATNYRLWKEVISLRNNFIRAQQEEKEL